MKVVQVPVLKDNVSYLIIDENQSIAAAVDPAEPKTVFDAANKENVTIKMILTTHHHWYTLIFNIILTLLKGIMLEETQRWLN
jgi:hypothetical protein